MSGCAIRRVIITFVGESVRWSGNLAADGNERWELRVITPIEFLIYLKHTILPSIRQPFTLSREESGGSV